MANGVMLLADGKIAFRLLKNGIPKNKAEATLDVFEDSQDASCSVAKSGFGIGAGTPNTESEGPLCQKGEVTIPVSQTYEAAMNILRFYDPETKQIEEASDFLFQALKEFGSTIPVAIREGGKDADEEPAEDDEWSFYELTSGGLGRSTDGNGYTKRVAHVYVTRALEDVTITAGTGG